MDVPGILRALEFALGGRDGDFRQIAVLAALEDRPPDFDGLLIERGVGAREAGAFAIVFVGQCGALHHAQHVAFLDHVAGTHLIDDGARGLGEQGGAYRRHHQAGGRHVAHERAALHHRGAHAFPGNDFLRRQPGASTPDGEQQYGKADTDRAGHIA